MPVLYRKYRPSSFNKFFVGHDIVKKSLTNSIMFDRIGHAYLFTGLKGSGKTTSARIYAKAVNCENNKEEKGSPCEKCKSCESISKNQAMDIIEIDAASNRGIDEIREIREQVKISPSQLRYKVYIIDEVHMLTKDAFNALLKTLEEPPAHAIFILVTTEPEKIPNTILSRVQRFDFKPLTKENLFEALHNVCKEEKIKIEDESIEAIIESSGGSVRDAYSILEKLIAMLGDDVSSSETKKILGLADISQIVNFGGIIFNGSLIQGIEFLQDLKSEGVKLNLFIKSFIDYLRTLVLLKVDLKNGQKIAEKTYNNAFVQPAKEVVSSLDGRKLVDWLKQFIELKSQMNRSEDQELLFEVKLMELLSDRSGSLNEVAQNPVQQVSVPQPVESTPRENMTAKPAQTVQTKVEDVKTNELENKVSPIMEEELDSSSIEKEIEQADVSSNPTKFTLMKDKKSTEEKEEVKKVEDVQPPVENLNLSIEDVQSKWVEIAESVKTNTPSLGAFLRPCVPIKVEGDKIVVKCQTKFHQSRFQDQKNYGEIVKVTKKVLNANISLDFVMDGGSSNEVQEVKKNENKKVDQTVQDALDVFGGEIVE